MRVGSCGLSVVMSVVSVVVAVEEEELLLPLSTPARMDAMASRT